MYGPFLAIARKKRCSRRIFRLDDAARRAAAERPLASGRGDGRRQANATATRRLRAPCAAVGGDDRRAPPPTENTQRGGGAAAERTERASGAQRARRRKSARRALRERSRTHFSLALAHALVTVRKDF